MDGLGTYYDGYTDADGNYLLQDVAPDFYYFGADALHHQPSFYPDGWPGGAYTFTVGTEPVIISWALVASNISWDPAEITVSVVPGGTTAETLTINNDGTGPYYFNISLIDSTQPLPPEIGALAVPGLPRVDEQIFSDIAASSDGTTDFVAVLGSQADVSAAYGIEDWNERGWAVYNILNQICRIQPGKFASLSEQPGSQLHPNVHHQRGDCPCRQCRPGEQPGSQAGCISAGCQSQDRCRRRFSQLR